jgi:hypothetical protein
MASESEHQPPRHAQPKRLHCASARSRRKAALRPDCQALHAAVRDRRPIVLRSGVLALILFLGIAYLPLRSALSLRQTLEAELDGIAALGLDEVRALWREMTQQNAPKALSRDLLARMIAYRVQEQRLGKLGRETRKLLDRLAKGGAEPVRHLKVGTV